MAQGLPKSIIKKYGISKKAWAVFRGKKHTKRGNKTMAKRKTTRRSYPRARRTYSRAKGFMGKLGIGKGMTVKSLIAGSAALIVAQRYQPFGGPYKPAIDKVASGIVLNVAHLDNADLISAGIKEGVATLVNGYLGSGSVNVGGFVIDY